MQSHTISPSVIFKSMTHVLLWNHHLFITQYFIKKSCLKKSKTWHFSSKIFIFVKILAKLWISILARKSLLKNLKDLNFHAKSLNFSTIGFLDFLTLFFDIFMEQQVLPRKKPLFSHPWILYCRKKAPV